MNLAHLFEAAMLVCFGFSWPINVVKAYRARTAKSTSLAFIFLIITGYVAGITAKIINQQFNYVLAVYFLNLVIVFSNVVVYFRNSALDKKAEAEIKPSAKTMIKKSNIVYSHEEHLVTEETEKIAKEYSVTLLGGTYDKEIPAEKLAADFELDFDLFNRSTFALSLKNAKEYFKKYVASLKSEGIILHLGTEDKELFRTNPAQFDSLYLELISAIKNENPECRLALVSVFDSNIDTLSTSMNNHIKAIAESSQAEFVNIKNAKLWNPIAVKSSLEFAQDMGLKIKKPLFDVAKILYSYAAEHVVEAEPIVNIAV